MCTRKTVFQVIFETVVIIENTVVAAMLGLSVQEKPAILRRLLPCTDRF